jgi:catechol 2,3-dioxygenase-like lactoylglutathione lyase family enzyme
MQLGHLGLPVRDRERSLAFYARYFGFDPATARTYDDGTVIVRNADRFDLALHPATDDITVPAFLHFGFTMPTPQAVRALEQRLSAAGERIVEHDDEPDLVSFKCRDPDGWRVEVYWERRPAENATGLGALRPDPAGTERALEETGGAGAAV